MSIFDKATIWAKQQRVNELDNFLKKFPISEYAPSRRKEREELIEEIKVLQGN